MIVVFDMDECIASLSEPCIMYHSYIQAYGYIPLDFHMDFSDKLVSTYLRPGIDAILKILYVSRHDIDNPILNVKHLVLMTNASNKYGWVEYVVNHIEKRLMIENRLFDLILPRESELRTQNTHRYKYGGLQPKFMSDVLKALKIRNKCIIIMYDDIDTHIVPAKGHTNHLTKVPPYYSHERNNHTRSMTFLTFLLPLFRAMNN
jgi:hypothetical protein